MLLVLRDSATTSSERLVSHLSFYLLYHHGNEPLTAAIQDAGKLGSLCLSLHYLWVFSVLCLFPLFVLVRILTEVNLLQHLEKIQRNHIILSWSDSCVLARLRNSSVTIAAANIISYSTQSTIFCM